MRSSVDLPEPDGPSRQTSSPSATVRSKLSTARTVGPNCLVTPLMSRTAMTCLMRRSRGRTSRALMTRAREQQREERRDPEDHRQHGAVLDHRLVVDERDHQHRHGADLRRADQPGALGLVEGVDEGQQHRGGDGRAGLRQGDRPEHAERRGADVARRFLHAPVDALEGRDRDPDHEEQRADELDQHHAPEIADQVEAEEDAGDGDQQAELREGLAGEEREEQQAAERETRSRAKAIGGRQADERRDQPSPRPTGWMLRW